jgi:hypothetical protein
MVNEEAHKPRCPSNDSLTLPDGEPARGRRVNRDGYHGREGLNLIAGNGVRFQKPPKTQIG